MRLVAKAEKDQVGIMLFKMTLNMLYGKFGQKLKASKFYGNMQTVQDKMLEMQTNERLEGAGGGVSVHDLKPVFSVNDSLYELKY